MSLSNSFVRGITTLAEADDYDDIVGQADGIASLDGSGKVPSAQLPSYVDDVLEYANLAAFPGTGVSGLIYVTIDTKKTYRWSGSGFVEISSSDVNSVNGRTGVVTGLAEQSSLDTEATARASADSTESAARIAADTSEASTRAAADTSEASTRASADSTLTASVAAKLPLAGGTMSGNIAMSGNSISGGGTATFGTFAGALQGNATMATTATSFAGFTSLSSFAPLASPTFSGTPTAPTFTGALAGNATTATTATTAVNLSGNIIESQVTSLTSDLAAKLALAGGTMSGAIAMGGNDITNGGVSTFTSLALTGSPLPVTSGGTGLASIAINKLLYASAANTLSALPYIGDAVLKTTSGGAPQWTATLPAVNGAALTSLTGANLTGAYTAAGLTLTNTGRILCSSSANSAAVEGVVGTGLSLSSGTLTNTVSASSGANPTASIGTTAVNGSASTFMRSDAAPAVDTTVIATLAGTQTLTGTNTVAPATRSSGVVPYFRVVTPADTAQTASTESIGIAFGGTNANPPAAVTRQYATGALSQHREYVFTAPTLSAVGASTITSAATVSISGPPSAGTNATLTNKYSLLSEGGTAAFRKVGGSAGTAEIRIDPSGADSNSVYTITANSNKLIFSTTYGGAGDHLALTTDGAYINGALSFTSSISGVPPDVSLYRVTAGVASIGTTGSTGTTAWLQVPGGRKRIDTADVTNATTTFSNVTQFSITCLAGRKYTGTFSLNCTNTAATEGIKFDFNGGTATATDFWAIGNQIAGNTTFVLGTSSVTTLAGVINFTTLTSGLVLIDYSFECNAAGTFILRMAENSTAIGTAKIIRGSNHWADDMAT